MKMSNETIENTSVQSAQESAPEFKKASTGPERKDGWEREVLEKLAFATLAEQRARRRWGIFFKLSFLAMIVFGFWMAFDFGGANMETVGFRDPCSQ